MSPMHGCNQISQSVSQSITPDQQPRHDMRTRTGTREYGPLGPQSTNDT